jgi:hypothetical protein
MHVFKPVLKLHILELLIFIKQKRYRCINEWAYTDRRLQQLLYDKAGASSFTVKMELGFMTDVVDAIEIRQGAIYDILGAFLHSKLLDTVHMKVVGYLVKMLLNVQPSMGLIYIIMENWKKVIHLLLFQALYVCLKLAL